MLLETEGGIMARADAQVVRLLMDGNRTARRLLAADRTLGRAWQRVALLRRFRATCDARQHAQIEREIAREITPSWGRTMRIKVDRVADTTSAGRKARHAGLTSTSSRRTIRAYQCPLVDTRGRVAIFFRVRYVGFKSKNWRPGLSADHALYILREEALEDGEIVGRLTPISNMGNTPEEIAACWRALEVAEEGYRANAIVQHRIIWNLPHGLTAEQRHELVETFCEREFGRLGLPYVAAIHKADAKGDQRNFHAHICFSTRPCDRVGEGQFEIALEKVNGLTDEDGLKRLRALACAHANIACIEAGLAVRFSHLTYRERGIDAVRQKHVGAAATAAHDRGEKVAAIEHNERVVESNEAAAARDAVARELALVTRLTVATKMAVDNAAALRRLAESRATVASIAERAGSLAKAARPVVLVSRGDVAAIAQRARAIAAALASSLERRPATRTMEQVRDVARAARRLADEQRSQTDWRARLAHARSRLVAIKTAVADRREAEESTRKAKAVLLDGAATPYVIRDGHVDLHTTGMTQDDASLVRSLDPAALPWALQERLRRDRARDAADALAREEAAKRQHEADEQRRMVEEVCRLLLDGPDRPYRVDGKVVRLDVSRFDEPSRTLVHATGAADAAIVAALRERFHRDRRDALDALVKAVEVERVFVATADDRYVVDEAMTTRFDVDPATIATAETQERMRVIAEKQEAELMPLVNHVYRNADQIVPADGGWTLSSAAPYDVKRVADLWRHNSEVQGALNRAAGAHEERTRSPMVEASSPPSISPKAQEPDTEPHDSWRATRNIREQAMAAWDDDERLDDPGLAQPGHQLDRPAKARIGKTTSIASWVQRGQGPGWGG